MDEVQFRMKNHVQFICKFSPNCINGRSKRPNRLVFVQTPSSSVLFSIQAPHHTQLHSPPPAMAGRLPGAAASSPLPRALLLLAALGLFTLSFLSLRSLRPAAGPSLAADKPRPVLPLRTSSSVYHSPEAFAAGYAEMERSFKVYIYPDGDAKTFYQTPRKLTGKYASEGYFFQNIRESRFRTDDPDEAHLFFVPISPHKMRGKVDHIPFSLSLSFSLFSLFELDARLPPL